MAPNAHPKSKAIARIRRGPAFVRLAHEKGAAQYHIGVVDPNRHPEDGVWLHLALDRKYAVVDYDAATIRVGGQAYALARRDADRFARTVAKAMRLRRQPMKWPRFRRRRAATPRGIDVVLVPSREVEAGAGSEGELPPSNRLHTYARSAHDTANFLSPSPDPRA